VSSGVRSWKWERHAGGLTWGRNSSQPIRSEWNTRVRSNPRLTPTRKLDPDSEVVKDFCATTLHMGQSPARRADAGMMEPFVHDQAS